MITIRFLFSGLALRGEAKKVERFLGEASLI